MGLLGKLLVCFGKKKGSVSKAYMLELPPEIIFLIADYLERHERFFLSQTCIALRRLTGCDWGKEVSPLPYKKKVDFWVSLAYTLPNAWVCVECCRLHEADCDDTPSSPRADCCVFPTRGLGKHYAIRHYHVQLALKYARLGKGYQKPLKKLMAPYTKLLFTGTSVKKTYKAQPKIVGTRFLLHEEWLYKDKSGPISQDTLIPYSLMVCPHIMYSHRMLTGCMGNAPEFRSITGPAKEFTKYVSAAYGTRNTEMVGSCRRCATDYAAWVSRDGRTVALRVWHDLGTFGSELDLSWGTQVWTNNNTPTGGLTLYHIAGSVRKLYLEHKA